MRFLSWNVNGLRACYGKGNFTALIEGLCPDVLCLQETKLQAGQIDLDLPEYHDYWNYAQRKGYSGTAVFTKQEPLNVTLGMDIPEHDAEGRVITCEFEQYYLVTVYTPNSQDALKRLEYRMNWENAFRMYLAELDQRKPVIVCGDMNVAHEPIDLANPESNRRNPGFTDEEREKMTLLLSSGFTDSFRYLHPEQKGAYSWWSYRMKARERGVGWRIDYFLISDRIRDNISRAYICDEIYGSDHCPVGIDILW